MQQNDLDSCLRISSLSIRNSGAYGERAKATSKSGKNGKEYDIKINLKKTMVFLFK